MLKEIFVNRKPSEPVAVWGYQIDKIFPIDIIAFFYMKNGIVYLTTFDKKTYSINKNMGELTKLTALLFIGLTGNN